MNARLRVLVLGIVTVLALPLLIKTARAASLGGWTGKALNPGDVACFDSQDNGSIQSRCSGLHQWDIPLLITSGGTHTTRIYTQAGVGGGTCTLYGFSQTGFLMAQQGGNLAAGGVVTLAVSMPAGAGANLLIRCLVPNGGVIQSVDYNQ
jgi:hypothetical protein